MEGVGKNSFTDMICEMLEPYTMQNMRMSNVTGRFNSIIVGRMLLVINEAETMDVSSKKTENAMNVLKYLATEKEIPIEEKFEKLTGATNTSNFIILTNSWAPASLSPADRRFFVLRANGKFLLSKTFFDRYYKKIERLKDHDAFLSHLISFYRGRDIRNFIPTQIPMTDEKMVMILGTMNPIDAWLRDNYDALTSREGLSCDDARQKKPKCFQTDRLFELALSDRCDHRLVRGKGGKRFYAYFLKPEQKLKLSLLPRLEHTPIPLKYSLSTLSSSPPHD